jgi:hypothetical protein
MKHDQGDGTLPLENPFSGSGGASSAVFRILVFR